MIDPILNRSLDESRELHVRWTQFRDFCLHAQKSRNISAQAELKFIELKSRIAMLHDGFLDTLDHDEKIGQNIMTIVSDSIMLRKVSAFNDAERQKFEFDWNECFMLLTEQISHLEEEKERLAGINERAHRAKQRNIRLKAAIHNFINGAFLKFLSMMVVLVFIFHIIPTYIWSYRGFYDIRFTRGIYLYFANNMYRPLFKEYRYDEMYHIPLNGDYAPPMGMGTADASHLNRDWLLDVEFPVTFKFGGAAINQVKSNLDAMLNLKGYVLTYGAMGGTKQEARVFYLFFNTAADAREFTDLVREVQSGLEYDDKKTISNNVGLYRSANFVGMGITAGHPVGPNHPKEFYRVWPEGERSLLHFE